MADGSANAGAAALALAEDGLEALAGEEIETEETETGAIETAAAVRDELTTAWVLDSLRDAFADVNFFYC